MDNSAMVAAICNVINKHSNIPDGCHNKWVEAIRSPYHLTTFQFDECGEVTDITVDGNGLFCYEETLDAIIADIIGVFGYARNRGEYTVGHASKVDDDSDDDTFNEFKYYTSTITGLLADYHIRSIIKYLRNTDEVEERFSCAKAALLNYDAAVNRLYDLLADRFRNRKFLNSRGFTIDPPNLITGVYYTHCGVKIDIYGMSTNSSTMIPFSVSKSQQQFIGDDFESNVEYVISMALNTVASNKKTTDDLQVKDESEWVPSLLLRIIDQYTDAAI